MFRILYGSYFTQSQTEGLPQNQQDFPQPALSSPVTLLCCSSISAAATPNGPPSGVPAQVTSLPGYLPITFVLLLSMPDPTCIFVCSCYGVVKPFPFFLVCPLCHWLFPTDALIWTVSLLLQRATAGWEASVCSIRHQGPVGGCCSGTTGGAAGVHPVPLGTRVF